MHRTASTILAAALLALGARTVPAQPLPTNVDHYLCYKASAVKGSAEFVPVDKALRDQFAPTTNFTLKKVVTLCNPADKNGEGIVHPEDHLVGYRIKAVKGTPRFVKRTHVTLDQFGSRTVQVLRPDSLLVPSSKALGSNGAPPYGTPGVRHYACYRARVTAFAPPPVPVVGDQFRTVPYALKKVTKLCAPVDKAGEDPGAPADPGHLVCYKVRGPKFPRTAVSTDNQIRAERLQVTRPAELCVPALKDPQATTTTTTTTSTTIPLPCGDPQAPPAPLCWGTCPPETPICAVTPTGCQCVSGTTPCGSASFPACDGVCGPDEACVVSPTLGCTCQFQGLPCAVAYAFTGACGGICPDPGDECVGPIFTPDGDGCVCVPPGSTCHLTCDPGGGNCPPGETCQGVIPGLCLCQ